ncbi:MAG: NADAR family protein [Gammaproteobacteria bacterium]|nr:NADAR family protein [Gammaproteobacteria bacterium]
MFFNRSEPEPLYVSRTDDSNPLSSFSRHGFGLDDAYWPTLEHYFQGMKFIDPDQRAAIRNTASPVEAEQLAEKHAGAVRKDWKEIRQTVMTRGVYIKCRTHADVAEALLMTGTQKIVENSMYDYYWGCGRDGRGHNTYGKVLMSVRKKLETELTDE